MSLGLMIGIAVLALIVAIALVQRSRPRVTQVEKHRETRDADRDSK